MSIEALVLALSAVIRPTTMAAVYAMLAARQPQRLLAAYLLAGLAFSVAVGTLVVVILHGVAPKGSSAASRPLLDVALGSAALACCIAVATGRLPRDRRGDGPGSVTWMRHRVHELSPAGAAVVGILTHLPGLVYLAALNAIAGSGEGTAGAVAQVIVYNAIWFSLAIVAFVLSAYRPDRARGLLQQLSSEVRRHRRVIAVVFLGVFGAYLVLTGTANLLGYAT